MNELIKNLERAVCSYNTVLKNKVGSMDVIELLRNVHPTLRTDFAYNCRDAGLIHPSEITEFIQKEESHKLKRNPKYIKSF